MNDTGQNVVQHFKDGVHSESVEDVSHAETLLPHELLAQFNGINVAAPMVRYSKLPARILFSQYNTHITYTPMMLAREFARSEKARSADFSTSAFERGIFSLDGRLVRGCLVAQFAAKVGKEFADAVELISPYVDGVDLNCGCPQPWAYKEEIGSYLLRQPHLVEDMVKMARNRTSSTYPISIKIRLDDNPKLTSQLVQTAIHAGASYIGVHGRTRHQKDTEPANLDGIKFAREEAKGAVPIVGNGDVFTSEESVRMRETTGVNAAMSARGLLGNPALFAGYTKTPLSAIDRFVDHSTALGFEYGLFHRHMMWMCEKHFPNKSERVSFNSELKSYAGVIDYLEDHRHFFS